MIDLQKDALTFIAKYLPSWGKGNSPTSRETRLTDLFTQYQVQYTLLGIKGKGFHHLRGVDDFICLGKRQKFYSAPSFRMFPECPHGPHW